MESIEQNAIYFRSSQDRVRSLALSQLYFPDTRQRPSCSMKRLLVALLGRICRPPSASRKRHDTYLHEILLFVDAITGYEAFQPSKSALDPVLEAL